MASRKREQNGDVLLDAHSLVTGDRNADYGDPFDNHQHIADIYNAWTGQNLLASDIARVHTATKMAREQNPNAKRDTYVDLPGYGNILWQCVREERERGIEREEED